jgi:hypothetical protein
LRGNPGIKNQRRSRKVKKVRNLGRVGKLEGAKPIFLLEKL